MWQHIRGQEPKDVVKTGHDAAKTAIAEEMKIYPDLAVHALPDLGAFVGAYCNDVYGKAVITRASGDQLHVKLNMLNFDLKPAGETRFFIPGMWAKTKVLDFQKTGPRAEGLSWALESTSTDVIRFQRCD